MTSTRQFSVFVRLLQFTALLAVTLSCIPFASAEDPARLAPRQQNLGLQKLFGPVVIQGGVVRRFGVDTTAPEPPDAPDAAGSQSLEFTDENVVHGALEGFDATAHSLLWRRDDASAPIPFSLSEIRRITFLTGQADNPAGHATVKFAGNEWLTGDVLEMVDRSVQLHVSEDASISIDRGQIEWIYFSEGRPPECYDGPTSFSGWISGGGWSYHDGALRATSPTIIGRYFKSLPDKVEYLIEIEQGAIVDAFTICLHGTNVLAPSQSEGAVQFQYLGARLQIVAQVGGVMQVHDAGDLSAFNLQAPTSPEGRVFADLKAGSEAQTKPFQLRVFEDRPGGRISIFINGRKIKDWSIDKRKAGGNGGTLSFQPLGWNTASDQAISRVRVLPWDGRLPSDKTPDPTVPESDLVALVDGDVKSGTLEDFGSETIKLRMNPDEVVLLPREKVSFLRFRHEDNPPDEDPPVAHVTLTGGGEFDVSAFSFRDGRFIMQSAFSSEMPLPPDVLRSLEFSHAPVARSESGDELVFHNGDRLHGFLDAAADHLRLRWRMPGSGALVDFDTASIAGAILSKARDGFAAKNSVFVRCRNGDLISATTVALDREHFFLGTSDAARLTIPRAGVQAVYFPEDGKPTVLGGAAGPTVLENAGANSDAPVAADEKTKPLRPPDPWRYFNGAFTLPTGARHSGTLRINPSFISMPESVEIAFDAISPIAPLMFSAQLFSGEQNSGYLLQFQAQGLFIYDMQPRQRAGVVPQQTLPFAGKIKDDTHERHIRLLADRPSGKLTMIVDGVVIGHFAARASTTRRNLGTVINLVPETGQSCTFSNFWIGPWNGRLPDSDATSDQAKMPDSVALSNGDETRGRIIEIGPDTLKMDCEAGRIELPTARLATLEFGASAIAPSSAARLRFSNLGVISVKSFQVENGAVTFQAELAGELKIPLADLRELVFAPGTVNEKP